MIELGDIPPEQAPKTEIVRRRSGSRKGDGQTTLGNPSLVPETLDFRFGRWQLTDSRELAAGGELACFLHPTDPRLRASIAAITEMLVARFEDLRSFDQQSVAMSETGLPVSRGLLTKWANEAAAVLAPVATAIAQTGMRAPVLSSANLAMGLAGEQSRRLWLFMANRADHDVPPLMWLRLTPDRSGGGFVAKELAAFKGILQAPGFSGYDRLALRNSIQLADCWRQVEDETRMIQMAMAQPFLHELAQIAPRLREIEARMVNEPSHVRTAMRQQGTKPLLDQAGHQLARLAAEVNPRLPFGAFVTDLWSRWPGLTAFLNDGRIDHENAALQKIRALGAHSRRWVFGRHEELRKSAAILYSIIGTCEMNDVDPRRYLRLALSRLMRPENPAPIDELIPWSFVETAFTVPVRADDGSPSRLDA